MPLLPVGQISTWVLPNTCTHRNAATPLVLQVFNSDALFADGSQLADFKQVCPLCCYAPLAGAVWDRALMCVVGSP